MPNEFIARNGITSLGNVIVSGSLTTTGAVTISGSIASASYAASASNALAAQTASYANAFTVASTLTAQTLVVQTITSSIDFVTGSTRFGSISSNTHQFTGSMSVSGSTIFNHNDAPTIKIQRNGGTDSNTVLEFTNASRSFYIGSNGAVMGLGGTSGAISSQPLQISSSGAATFSSTVDGTIFNSTSNAFRFSGNNAISLVSLNAQNVVKINAAGYWGTQLVGANDQGILINNTGNIGIGITTPNISGYAGKVLTIGTGVIGETAIEMYGSVTTDETIGDFTCLNAASSDSDKRVSIIRTIRSSANNSSAMLFYTKNSGTFGERMRITSGGAVGIGTTTTNGLLSLRAEQTNTPTIVFQNSLGAPNSAISNYASAGQTFTIIGTNFYINSVGAGARFNTNFEGCGIALDSGDIGFSTGTSGITPTQRMRILSGGDINISGGNVRSLGGGYLLRDSANTTTGGLFTARRNWLGTGTDISPTIAAEGGYGIYTYTNGGVSPSGPYISPGGTTWTNGSSDVRKKKNFETTQGLAEILQVEPIKYHFNEDDDNSKKRLGFKAQNILPLIPEMVSETGEMAEDGSPYLTITPDYMLPVLVKAIQELEARVKELENK